MIWDTRTGNENFTHKLCLNAPHPFPSCITVGYDLLEQCLLTSRPQSPWHTSCRTETRFRRLTRNENHR